MLLGLGKRVIPMFEIGFHSRQRSDGDAKIESTTTETITIKQQQQHQQTQLFLALNLAVARDRWRIQLPIRSEAFSCEFFLCCHGSLFVAAKQRTSTLEGATFKTDKSQRTLSQNFWVRSNIAGKITLHFRRSNIDRNNYTSEEVPELVRNKSILSMSNRRLDRRMV